MHRKTDPRVIRTRQMLRDALIALIPEKGYDDVTIQDITDKAGLRRATFYLHYKDKEELVLAILGETFDELVCEMEKLNLPHLTPKTELAVNLLIFNHAQQNAALYKSILGGHGAVTITRYIREYLAQDFLDEIRTHNPTLELTMPVEIVANFSATIKLNMAIWWLDQGMPYSPEQMAEMVTKLILTGMQSVLQASPPKSS